MAKTTKANKKVGAEHPALHETGEVRCVVNHQGAPIINGAVLTRESKDIVFIKVDCNSKYCKVVGHFSGDSCGIYVSANERSLNLKNDVDRDEPIRLTFPDFAGWEVFATNVSRYTILICLIKN
jgi:hypothetical protein